MPSVLTVEGIFPLFHSGGGGGMGTPAERCNEGLFRPLERVALGWLAEHMPPWVTPDILTGVGVFGALVTFAGYAFSGSHPALLCVATLGLAINWLGDSLDGTVARLRKIERPRYGYYLDNAVDCLAALLLAVGIGISGYVRFDLCFLMLSAYTMISVLTFLRANVSGIVQVSYGAIGPTEVRIGFAVLNALIILFPPVPFVLVGITLKYPDLLTFTWSVLTIITFMVCMAKQVRQLAAEEPPLQRGPSLRHPAKIAASHRIGTNREIGRFAKQAEPVQSALFARAADEGAAR
jgi:archaetidylinositol phosphate synthase